MLDRTGFKRRRFQDLFEEMEDKARETFGDQINTSERSPLGIILRLFAWFLAKLWGTAEDVYNSGYKNSAAGNNLDRLGPYSGVTRILEQWATGEVVLTGTAGKTIETGFQAATETGVYFETLEDVVIGPAGTVTAAIEALDSGSQGNVAAGAITIIVNPNPDITAVSNPERTQGGREKETDAEFRDRMDQAVAGGGAASLDALRGALLRLDNVRAAAVIENNTMQADPVGRPAKSYQAYVLGGDDQAIAEMIFQKGAAGIESHGDITVQVPDLGGYVHDVKFSRAEEVQLQISVDVTKNDSYPADGDEQIRSALVRYVGGEDGGSYYNGLNMGASVIYTRLISAVYSVPGVEDVSVLVGSGNNLQPANVQIQPFQVAQVRATDIEVISHV
ncbi:baseplate protein [Paenibacillus algicola]|uniref:Baseplate protein n=1 Tax=Paenibacillus algicola TaxID=2565926 RepID=A0A4P8XNV5_9BACL|nr:baseplate J/gp47 family protein [Paenibacillus algicola]QCT03281.1 baseplate protein [Paenibacillus algicola]